MATDTHDISIDAASSVWDALGAKLEAFAAAWEAGPPPDPSAFVPPGPLAVRRLVLVELVKYDLDQRLQRGLERPLEEYLSGLPLLASDPPCDLLYEDFQLRRAAGRPVDPADYFRRFPAQADELARLLGGTHTGRTTAAFAARVPPDIRPGDHLDDFDLLAQLGEGQFAKVFLARQRGMQRLVALKVSAARAAEAEVLAQLDHPNIVRVYDQRYLDARKVLLVYMPYLPGGTLQHVLDRVREVPPADRTGKTLLEAVDRSLEQRGELPPAASGARAQWAGRSWPEAVCALGAKLASALDYAHRRDVLHRDVKPANVLLTAEGEPLLADFNVGSCSKLDGAGPAAFFGGSLAYMAVEHLEAFDPTNRRPAESVDGRADLFGLAVTLWELLTGSRPFGPETVGPTWAGTVARLAELRRAGPAAGAVAGFPDGVPGFREVLLRCLDPDPENRPATAGELARELELCLRPVTRKLVRPAPGGWRAFVLRHPVVSLYAPSLLPNVVASVLNISYNDAEIMENWKAARPKFQSLLWVVNLVFFPIGMGIVGVALWPVLEGLARVRAGGQLDRDHLAFLRRRCLRLGIISTWTVVGCWAVAGVVWPLALRLLTGVPPNAPVVYVYFLLSLVVFGLLAVTYPYFTMTFLAVRVLYPALLGPDGPAAADRPALERVNRELSVFNMIATGVPLVAVIFLGLMLWLGQSGRAVQFSIVVLGAVGLAGTALAYILDARIRDDLAALADVPARTS
jgi:serine/threonine protein kinase